MRDSDPMITLTIRTGGAIMSSILNGRMPVMQSRKIRRMIDGAPPPVVALKTISDTCMLNTTRMNEVKNGVARRKR